MLVLFLGDVFGKPGRKLLVDHLESIIQENAIDFCIINGENLADGKGLTEKTTKPLFELGVDAITGGNHLWDRAESLSYIGRTPCIVKPLNYPESAPGSKWFTICKGELSLTVISLSGQVYMPPADSPFAAFDRHFESFRKQTKAVLLDFHAESTAEKRALGWYVDGRVSALIGTHTHIQTADEELLPNGTAYITDAGMTGPHDSVIGIKKKIIIDKMTSSVPIRYEVSDQGLQINGVILDIDNITGQAAGIKRLRISTGD